MDEKGERPTDVCGQAPRGWDRRMGTGLLSQHAVAASVTPV